MIEPLLTSPKGRPGYGNEGKLGFQYALPVPPPLFNKERALFLPSWAVYPENLQIDTNKSLMFNVVDRKQSGTFCSFKTSIAYDKGKPVAKQGRKAVSLPVGCC